VISDLLPPEAQHRETLVAWVRDYLAKPYPGPGFARAGAICPYARQLVADNRMHVMLARDVDGSTHEPVLQAALALGVRTITLVPADDLESAVVLAFPDMPDRAATAALDAAVSALARPLLEVGVMFACASQDPDSCGDDPWPRGARSPMPTFVMRRMGPWDSVFMRSEPFARAHHERYLSWYLEGRMTPQVARSFESMCAPHDLPLTRAG